MDELDERFGRFWFLLPSSFSIVLPWDGSFPLFLLCFVAFLFRFLVQFFLGLPLIVGYCLLSRFLSLEFGLPLEVTLPLTIVFNDVSQQFQVVLDVVAESKLRGVVEAVLALSVEHRWVGPPFIAIVQQEPNDLFPIFFIVEAD